MDVNVSGGSAAGIRVEGSAVVDVTDQGREERDRDRGRERERLSFESLVEQLRDEADRLDSVRDSVREASMSLHFLAGELARLAERAFSSPDED